LHVLMQKVHTIRNDKNKKRKEAHVESLRLQAKRMAKKEETLNEVRVDLSVPLLLCPWCRWCSLQLAVNLWLVYKVIGLAGAER
jgi:hypothetical protein